jgi:hypothetical protein
MYFNYKKKKPNPMLRSRSRIWPCISLPRAVVASKCTGTRIFFFILRYLNHREVAGAGAALTFRPGAGAKGDGSALCPQHRPKPSHSYLDCSDRVILSPHAEPAPSSQTKPAPSPSPVHNKTVK